MRLDPMGRLGCLTLQENLVVCSGKPESNPSRYPVRIIGREPRDRPPTIDKEDRMGGAGWCCFCW